MQKRKNFYAIFLGFLIKKGKKNTAVYIVKRALLKSSKLLKLPAYYILSQIFKKLNAYVEVRRVNSRNRSHLVPFPIPFFRRSYLVAKWFLFALKANKNIINCINKIVIEIILLLKKNSSSHSYTAKLENEKQALINRSNLHFRW